MIKIVKWCYLIIVIVNINIYVEKKEGIGLKRKWLRDLNMNISISNNFL